MVNREDQVSTLRTAGYSGVLFLFLSMIFLYTDLQVAFSSGRSITAIWVFTITSILLIPVIILFFRGFVSLADRFDSSLLYYSTYIYIILLIATLVPQQFVIRGIESSGVFFSLISLQIPLGITAICFGSALLSIRDEVVWGNISGGLEIIIGIMFLTVVGGVIGSLLSLLAVIFESLMLLDSAEDIRNQG